MQYSSSRKSSPLRRLDCWYFDGRARLGLATQVVGNHEGSALKIARWVFGLWSFFGTKPFVVVPLSGCSLLVVNKNGGGGLMLTKCWIYGRATCPVGCQCVDQAPNLLQCQAPTWRPSAEPTQYQAPDRTPRQKQLHLVTANKLTPLHEKRATDSSAYAISNMFQILPLHQSADFIATPFSWETTF